MQSVTVSISYDDNYYTKGTLSMSYIEQILPTLSKIVQILHTLSKSSK